MTCECAATIDILALIITFFGFRRDLVGTTGMSRKTTKRTIHHDYVSFVMMLMLCKLYHVYPYSLKNYSSAISKSEIFTSNSKAEVKPLSFNEWTIRVNIQSALSISGLNPLTVIGISGYSSARPTAS